MARWQPIHTHTARRKHNPALAGSVFHSPPELNLGLAIGGGIRLVLDSVDDVEGGPSEFLGDDGGGIAMDRECGDGILLDAAAPAKTELVWGFGGKGGEVGSGVAVTGNKVYGYVRSRCLVAHEADVCERGRRMKRFPPPILGSLLESLNETYVSRCPSV